MERRAAGIKNRSLNNISLCAIAGILWFVSCTPKYGLKLHNGDLLFVCAGGKNLSGAIDRVTQTGSHTHYDHIALLEKKGNKFHVFQSNIPRGSEAITLNRFLEEAGQPVDVYRLKKAYLHDAQSAIRIAKTLLGKPYNYTYIPSDTAFYCSDFIQRCFAKDSIFTLHPMTFKDASGKTDGAWIEFYRKLHLEVPEGKPGCNPNGMAASDKIYYTGKIKKP